MKEDQIKLNTLAVDALRESAKWSTFLAIIGFIFIGLMVIAGIGLSAVMSAIPDDPYGGAMGMNPFASIKTYLGGIYIVMALIYFFPVYYLYKYATGTKRALELGNDDEMATALVNLKSHHKFLGIFTIVMIVIYVLGIIAFAVTAASFAGSGM
ncbi:hypothetical protein [Flavobacterium sp.]